MDRKELWNELWEQQLKQERNKKADEAVKDNLYNRGFREGYRKGYKDGAEAIAFHHELLSEELVAELEKLPAIEDSAGQDRFLAYDVIRTVKEFFREDKNG